jgi:hypothetical protein
MGILKHLLFWPVTGPLFLAEFSIGKVNGVVREELTDDSRIKAELMELQLKLELGDIDDEQYIAMEADLMQQLREIRQWREEFGMGVQGGPVRVQSQPREVTVVPDDSADVVSEDDARAAAAEDQVDGAPRVADPKRDVDIELNFDWD